jgi:hypothetical protein
MLTHFNAPAHREVLTELVQPVRAERSAVQFRS